MGMMSVMESFCLETNLIITPSFEQIEASFMFHKFHGQISYYCVLYSVMFWTVNFFFNETLDNMLRFRIFVNQIG